MVPEAAAILDHIVILVPHSTLSNLPTWLTSAFAISPGGRHADGVTENKLILFSDGIYLELIAFIPGKEVERAHHRWGKRAEGTIIDWANTLYIDEDLDIIRDRMKTVDVTYGYADAVEGGRTTDGVDLKWLISTWGFDSTPSEDPTVDGEYMGAELPFFCFDRTPRDLRVPYKTAPNHPSGASGIAHLAVFVADEFTSWLVKNTYDCIQGGRNSRDGRGRKVPGQYRWEWPLRAPDGRISARDDRVPVTGSVVSPARTDDTLPWPKISMKWSPEIGKEKCRIELCLLSSKTTTGVIEGRLGDGLPWLKIEFVSP